MPSTRSICLVVLLAATVFRLFHLGGPPDIPDWRQADTGYMALRMMEEWPPEMLHPKAPYRGLNDVKAAEYPIYPFVVSLVYRAAGSEWLPGARLVTLLFFAGSTLYLGLAVARIFGSRAGWLCAALYAMLPLGIPYSRMIHPDFCVIFFANGFFYHAVAFLQGRRIRDYFLAVLLCCGLFLMKAPYGFYFGLPLGLLALDTDIRRMVKDVALLGGMVVIPLMLGLWFNEYRIQQEAPHEESLVYPMKWTKESLNARFFGTLEQRFETERWTWMIRRGVILVSTIPGALLALGGLFAGGEGWRDRRRWIPWLLGLGLLAYILLVFPMVTSDHDYYSIPLMSFVALSGAVVLDRLARLRHGAAIVAAAFALLAAGSVYGIQRGPFLRGTPYFTRDWQRIEAAATIKTHTRDDDLVVSVMVGRSTGWSDPRVLWLADRLGWAIEGSALNQEALTLYREAGATVAAVFIAPGRGSVADEIPVLRELPLVGDYPVQGPDGAEIGRMMLVDVHTR